VFSTSGDQLDNIVEGSVFKVIGINGGMLELMPVKKLDCHPVMITAEILALGLQSQNL
jgi:hypothetical protein